MENALGKPVDRKYLVFWVSRAISDIVTLSLQPTGSEYRTWLSRIARGGRRWLQQIEACPGGTSLPPSIDQAVLTATVTKFCDQVESLADQITASIKPGHPRTPRLLEAFLDRMIGIAKRAKVLPSTPSRAVAPRRPPPAFLQFVLVAISTAKAVIKSSELSEGQKKAALSILRFHSKEALIKIVERLRGRIQDYRHSAYGLPNGTASKLFAPGTIIARNSPLHPYKYVECRTGTGARIVLVEGWEGPSQTRIEL